MALIIVLLKLRLFNVYRRFFRFILQVSGRLVRISARGYHDERVIQHALDYVSPKKGRKIVELESGTYVIEDTITLGSNVTLIGSGKTIIDGTKVKEDEVR